MISGTLPCPSSAIKKGRAGEPGSAEAAVADSAPSPPEGSALRRSGDAAVSRVRAARGAAGSAALRAGGCAFTSEDVPAGGGASAYRSCAGTAVGATASRAGALFLLSRGEATAPDSRTSAWRWPFCRSTGIGASRAVAIRADSRWIMTRDPTIVARIATANAEAHFRLIPKTTPNGGRRGLTAWSLRRIRAGRSGGGGEVVLARKSESAASNSRTAFRHSAQWARWDSKCARSPGIRSPSWRRERKPARRAGWALLFFISSDLSGFYEGAQEGLQLSSSSRDSRFDGPDGQFERCRDLLVAPFLQVSQHDGHPELGRQELQRFGHVAS